MARVPDEELHPALTEREAAVLRLLADGLSNRDIGEQLCLSVNTVKWHTQRLFDKLSVRRRTQAIAAARSLGLLDASARSRGLPMAPALLTPMVGREQELANLIALMASPDVRLVTILGLGGIGKTRLALALAEHQQASASQRVVLVRLEGVTAPDDVVLAIAGALSFQFGSAQAPQEQLLRYLRDAEMLLILDNFEHVLDAALLVSDALSACEQLKVVTTSRERLNLRGEFVFALEGLAYPADIADWERFSAMQLFVQGARRTQYRLELTLSDMEQVGRICRLVDGMPLAIEIASGWVDVLSPGEIAAEIGRSLSILTAQARDLPERHRSMEAVFEHSWRLLAEDEQAVFKKLAVFRGGFNRAAAEAVAGASLFVLSTLVDKSLVKRVAPDRFALHELLRQFAEEQLRADPDEHASTLDRHCHHYGTLLREFEENFRAHASVIVEGLNRLRLDYDNILAGWYRAIEQPLIGEIGRYSVSISMLFAQRGLFATGVQTLQQALRQMDAHHDQVRAADRLRVLTLCGMFLDTVSDYTQGSRLFREAMLLSETRPEILETDSHVVGLLLTFATWNPLATADFSQARGFLERSLALNLSTGFEFGIWQCQATLGIVELAAGNYEAARQAHDESLQCARRIQDRSALVCSLALLSCDCAILGDVMQARDFLRQTLDMSREFWVADAICTTIIALGLLQQHGQPETALDTLALLLHHPQCGGLSRMQIKLLLDRYRMQLSPAHVEAALEKASQGQLSTSLLEPDFVINAAFIDHLVTALDQTHPEANR